MSKSLEVLSPYDQRSLGEIELVDKKKIDQKLAIADALAKDSSAALLSKTRKEILLRTAELIKDNAESFAVKAAEEGGKPLIDSRVEIARATEGVTIAANEIDQLAGTQIPMNLARPNESRLSYTLREPIGVVVAISAFNHPFNLIVHQVAPAVAVGCPVIVKPASTTPYSCENFVNTLYEAGLPEDWCQMVVCENNAAEKLATDSRVNFLSFIGSAKVGWHLRSQLAPGTRCALEHGGVAPVIIEADADIDDALPLIAKGGFYHAGQVCVSVQRVYVHASIASDFAHRLQELAEKLVVGDPLDEKTEVGPLILPREVSRVEEWVREAQTKHGEILCGGKPLSETCFLPTVLFNPADDALVSTQEVFGPVVCVYSYSSIDEAISRANALPYSFQAAVFTKDIDRAFHAVEKLDAAAVMVNDHTAFRVDWMPFGGRKHSGLGVGGIPYSMRDLTEEKLFVIRCSNH